MTDSSALPASAADYAREWDFASKVAREAGEIVMTFHELPTSVQWKDGSEPVTEADRAANAHIVRQIQREYPDDGILAEESVDDPSRLTKERVWLVDPLDGTVEFIARNGQFSIMIALVVGQSPVMGVVYQPVNDVLYAAALGAGAYMEEHGDRHRLAVTTESELSRLRPVVSRSHRPPLLDVLLRGLGVQKERVMGSLGLKAGLLAQGQVDFYLHPSGGPKEWDTAAPEIIIREAGGVMTDCWGRALRYNQRHVRRSFGLLASNRAGHRRLQDEVSRLLDAAGLDAEFGFEPEG